MGLSIFKLLIISHFTCSNLCIWQRYRIFFFRGKVGRPFTHSNLRILFFFPRSGKNTAHFWRFFLFFFFWSGKVHRSFIHSNDKLFFFPVSEKKNRFFIHSIGFAKKCVKNELCREKKKYGTFAYGDKLINFGSTGQVVE